MLMNVKLRTGKRGKNRANWEKSTKEARVHTGLQCHRRRTRRSVYCSSVCKKYFERKQKRKKKE
jgi:hypothetical protein